MKNKKIRNCVLMNYETMRRFDPMRGAILTVCAAMFLMCFAGEAMAEQGKTENRRISIVTGSEFERIAPRDLEALRAERRVCFVIDRTRPEWPDPVLDCGDVNGDGSVTPGDGYTTLNYFGAGPQPVSCWIANVNGDSGLTPGDGYHLLNYFGGGPALNCAPCSFAVPGPIKEKIRSVE
jgi:hypothetical protein